MASPDLRRARAGLVHRRGTIRRPAGRHLLRRPTPRSWSNARNGAAPVTTSACIDIPPVLLTSADLPRKLEAAVTLFGLAPEHVTFEVTEDAWLQEKGIAREVLTRLRLRGFGLAIDGFGTGFSTIKQLIDAPFNEMKLDPILINMAPADREMTIALSSYVAVAHQLDMTIVADKLETAAQEAFAASSGCDQIQGPWIAPPMSAHELAHWLDQHRTIADPKPAAVCA